MKKPAKIKAQYRKIRHRFKKGWLKRQVQAAKKDIATWPEWMRREAIQ